MVIAIGLGSIVGNAVANIFGLAGGIIGTLLTGFVIYLLYAFLSGMSIKLFAGIIFSIIVWLANMIAGLVSGWTGMGGGLITLIISAIIAMFLWSNFGAGMAGQSVATTSKTSKKRTRRKR